jgi:glycosyltransferase involved in cell wall biosynthesis
MSVTALSVRQARLDRPGLAIVSQELTPYRVHLHRRVAREIPELKLWSLVTWDPARSGWRLRGDDEIGAVRFGEGEQIRRNGPLSVARIDYQKASALWRWLDAHNIGAVLAFGYFEISLLAPILWAYKRHVPYLIWGDSNIHGDHATGLKLFAKRQFLGCVLQRASAVLACGRYGREFFLKYGANPDRIFLSPYEPDYGPLLTPDEATVRTVSERFGLRPGRKRALVCGRLAKVKRPDLAVDAFVAVADERPEWDLILAGDGPLRDMVKARIPQRLRDRVVMTGFIADQNTVTALYHASDLLLHPADFEPWALVINEAVAAGMAVVTTSVVGAAAELVRDGVNGRICPPGSLPCLIDALSDATRPERLFAMRQESRRVLADWRRDADPVQGIRNALSHARVVPASE